MSTTGIAPAADQQQQPRSLASASHLGTQQDSSPSSRSLPIPSPILSIYHSPLHRPSLPSDTSPHQPRSLPIFQHPPLPHNPHLPPPLENRCPFKSQSSNPPLPLCKPRGEFACMPAVLRPQHPPGSRPPCKPCQPSSATLRPLILSHHTGLSEATTTEI